MKLNASLQELDKTDRKILSILLSNGRESIAVLSRTVNLSRTAVKERMLRMERLGVIKGYTVQIRQSEYKLNEMCYLHIQCVNGQKEDAINHLREIPEIRNVSVVGGQLDLIAQVEAQSLLGIHTICNDIESFDCINSTSMMVILHRPIDR
ncbi:Lrp/AsnC family transcriptional regulator [Vibrio owensii]|uniref:Lrp/AsnC family transcriptional regulator n=1 Tax=Vibrio owensii TaxID=696485 RepID=UPI003AACC8E9